LLSSAIGLALLIWAISIVLSDENAAARQRLADAPMSSVALLGATTLAGVLIAGLTFWVTLLPIRRISLLNVFTINAIAIFLVVLPFKIGFAMRVMLHHRVDALPFRIILAWCGAMAALGAATIVPLTAISLWRGKVDAAWWIILIPAMLFTHIVGLLVSRWTNAGAMGGVPSRLILNADDITSRPTAIAMHAGARIADMTLLAVRFAIAGGIVLGAPIEASQAIILASTFFVLSVITPLGTLGVREWGVALVGKAVGLDFEIIMTITLVVAFSELAAAGFFALVGSAFVHPWKRRIPLTADRLPDSPDCSARSSQA
jgi:hypothetical protein